MVYLPTLAMKSTSNWTYRLILLGMRGVSLQRLGLGGCRLKEYLSNFWLIPLLSIEGLLRPAPGATFGSSSAVELKKSLGLPF